MLDDGAVFVEVPRVEDMQTLAGELRAAGVAARPSIVRGAAGRRMRSMSPRCGSGWP
jgi:hypothetical protein